MRRSIQETKVSKEPFVEEEIIRLIMKPILKGNMEMAWIVLLSKIITRQNIVKEMQI